VKGELLLLRKQRWVIAVALVLSLFAAACGDDGGGEESQTKGGTGEGEAIKGGTWRNESTSLEFTGGFDPSGEYLSWSFALHGMLMHRNLVTYKHVKGAEGNVLVEDLAEEVPEPSEDGLTYTFNIKDGIMWAPPVDREIVCDDFAYALGRIDVAEVVAQYGSYYDGTIEGMDGPKPYKGEVEIPSGVNCVDEKTLEITLTQPTPDILYRLAMPAAAPIPAEVADCFNGDKAGAYGPYQVSSGPYMFEGLDEMDISSCDTIKETAPSGFEAGESITLVRNPNYDPATDSPEVRENNPDRWEFTTNTNEKDIFDKIANGKREDTTESPLPDVLQEYATDPELEKNLLVASGDRTWYITMNLTQPPFDDIHVRKAANLVLDKAAIQRVWGGKLQGDIATHILPPEVTGGHPTNEEYDPYPSPNFAGDVEAAKKEMALSKYDSDGDGECDDPVCEEVFHVNRKESPYTEMTPIIEQSFEQIGITLKTNELLDAYPVVSTVAKELPISTYPGWGKDYPDAYTFVGFLFQGGDKILCEGNYNYSLVGADDSVAKRCGADGNFEDVPAVDADIEACLEEELGDAREACFIELDKKLMEEVVPWVPYLWEQNITTFGSAVTKFDYDQFSGETSYAHVAVDESKQQ
jgi:peptide/nickel transport system substrate-binding protein